MHHSLRDKLLISAGQALSTLHGEQSAPATPSPALTVSASPEMKEDERRLSGQLMRVNHAGELAAQGLYHGQALTARDAWLRAHMEQAAKDEGDHLAWCAKRLDELDTRKSRLSHLWYLGSYTIGALAGLAGDRWSLGFVHETEHQVVKHLQKHIQRLPRNDVASREILVKMQEDESHHAQAASQSGARALPWPVRQIMKLSSKAMTITAFRL